MTDLEMTKRCAAAMDLRIEWDDPFTRGMVRTQRGWAPYMPLKDDEQAMALVKHLQARGSIHISNLWLTFYPNHDREGQIEVPLSGGLNRAIVECVACTQRT